MVESGRKSGRSVITRLREGGETPSNHGESYFFARGLVYSLGPTTGNARKTMSAQ